MAAEKPNILVIWGDDIGITNLSCYSDGLMGYRTPNIDRIADEGMRFTDSYGEQSCTAGRSSFITGQSVFRTGLSKVGVPAAPIGLRAEDPTIAELLKPLGYSILVLTASAVVTQFLETFKEFPPRQHAASFTIDQAVAKLEAALTAGQ
jgi:arylsulfatase A-like enzyme